jgi:hypothetical protein
MPFTYKKNLEKLPDFSTKIWVWFLECNEQCKGC